MTHKVRRHDRLMPKEQAWDLLVQGEYGVLATCGPDTEPYAVPLSYVIIDDSLYFHCAHSGRKLENIRYCPKVSFNVVGKTQPTFVNNNNYTTFYESVTVTGLAEEVTENEEKIRILIKLCEKYLPQHLENVQAITEKSLPATAVYRITISDFTCKEKKQPGI